MSRRILRIAVVAVLSAGFAACSNPMGPSGKLPSGSRDNLVNPGANLVNPGANVVNPGANLVNPGA